jgi:hypothetical protein
MQQLQFLPMPERAPSGAPLSRGRKALIAVVIAGAVIIASIGFAGSYTAVSALAAAKGFGWFSYGFPIGIDAGIIVFLALDLVLAGFRMHYALLRPAAWFLTAATITFNGTAAWGDWIAVGMHAIIPVLFVVLTEAARYAVGRLAAIETGRVIESPPVIRWMIAPASTFRIWRSMRLWQLTSYGEVIVRQRELAAFRTKLRARYGRRYRRKISGPELLALRLARFGTPVAEALAQGEAEAEAAREAEAQQAAEARRGAEAEAERQQETEAKQRADAEARQLAEIECRRRLSEAEAAADLAAFQAELRLAEAKAEAKRAPEAEAEVPEVKSKQARTQPEAAHPPKPKPAAKPTPKSKPAELGGRRAQVESEVEAVLALIEAEGYGAVGLERVKADFALKHGAAYDRLCRARERYSPSEATERRAE